MWKIINFSLINSDYCLEDKFMVVKNVDISVIEALIGNKNHFLESFIRNLLHIVTNFLFILLFLTLI